MVNPRRNVERFAPVKARMVRLTILATSDRTEPCIDELEVYTAATRGTPPRNVALASAGGKASASSEYPGRGDPQDRSSERRPPRQRPELDFAGAGKGSITIAWPEPATIDRVVWGRDREERLPRPPGDRVLRRGGPRAGPVAGRRLVARSRPL